MLDTQACDSCCRDRHRHRDRDKDREEQHLLEVRALQQLHHKVKTLVFRAPVVSVALHDVDVADAARCPRFTDKLLDLPRAKLPFTATRHHFLDRDVLFRTHIPWVSLNLKSAASEACSFYRYRRMA
jgi:hypothetical protein